MKIRAAQVTALVATGLIAIAAVSAGAYALLQPKPTPAQVIYGSGRIEADEVRVASEVPGRLVEVTAIEGQALEAGGLLARLDPVDFELQSDRAAAQLVAIDRASTQLDVQIEVARHHAGAAKRDLDRYESLGRQGWIPAQRLDLVRNNYVQASDQVSVLRQQRQSAQAQAAAASKSLQLARSQLAKTRIFSPLGGMVLERLAEPGEVVAAGQPLAVIADLSTVRLKIFIRERDLGKVRLGAPVRIRVDAFPGRWFVARVARIDAQAQFTPRDVHIEDERSRTVYGVTVVAQNPDGFLKPGMPADAWILWDTRAGWPDRLTPPD